MFYFFVDDGVKIYVSIFGEGLFIVMLYGWILSYQEWVFFFGILIVKYQVFCWDVCGYGGYLFGNYVLVSVECMVKDL